MLYSITERLMVLKLLKNGKANGIDIVIHKVENIGVLITERVTVLILLFNGKANSIYIVILIMEILWFS